MLTHLNDNVQLIILNTISVTIIICHCPYAQRNLIHYNYLCQAKAYMIQNLDSIFSSGSDQIFAKFFLYHLHLFHLSVGWCYMVFHSSLPHTLPPIPCQISCEASLFPNYQIWYSNYVIYSSCKHDSVQNICQIVWKKGF